MERFAIAAVTVVAFLALLVAALPFIIPGSLLRDMVAERLSYWTGRTVIVESQPRFSLYPELVVTVENVTFKNPPDMGDEAFTTVEPSERRSAAAAAGRAGGVQRIRTCGRGSVSSC